MIDTMSRNLNDIAYMEKNPIRPCQLIEIIKAKWTLF